MAKKLKLKNAKILKKYWKTVKKLDKFQKINNSGA